MAVAAGLAVAAGGGAMAFAATSGNGQPLRVAGVMLGNVTQTVDTSGAITSSVKYTPSFASSGAVKTVSVEIGDTVRKGQTLAALDTTALRAALDAAKATLARDRQQLEADETGQTSSGGGSSTPTAVTTAFVRPLSSAPATSATATSATATSASAVPSAPTPSGTDLVAQIKAMQHAVVAAQQALDAGQADVDTAQHTVDAEVTTNTQLRDAQVAACGTTPPPAEPSTDCTSAMAAYQASADALAADVAILDAKIATQDTNTKTLDRAIAALDALISKLQATSNGGSAAGGGGTSSHGGSSGNSATSGASTGSNTSNGSNGSNGSSGSTNQPASAAQLAADQAGIDAARAQVTVAEQNLAAATLTSPINGRVAAIGLTAGSSSSGQTITIVGTGVQGVSVTVPLPLIDQVKKGQRAAVAADGSTKLLHGTVAAIGLVSSSSGSTTTFPVTIRLDAGSARLYDGTGADVVITTGHATRVLVVPNSAIHTLRGTNTVTVVKNGKPTAALVTVGIAGGDVTQIKSGLKAGEQVELADPSQALPSSTSSNTGSRTFGGFGGFSNVSRFPAGN